MANAILTGRYIRSTFVEDQREFVKPFQYGKQIGKVLDIKNQQTRHQAPKHIYWVWDLKNMETRFIFEMFENILNLLTEFLCRMDHTLFQTSSRGSEIKQNRFGRNSKTL